MVLTYEIAFRFSGQTGGVSMSKNAKKRGGIRWDTAPCIGFSEILRGF